MLYRFEIALSDIDRGIYTALDFRANQHQSETEVYLLTRALAFALSYQDGLEFSPSGLADPDAPALQAKSLIGDIELWIEIGNPSSKKLHRASKTAKRVEVYTYKNPELLIKEIAAGNVHRAGEIKIFGLDQRFLQDLEQVLQKNNRWSVLHQEGHLDIDTGAQTFSTDLRSLKASV